MIKHSAKILEMVVQERFDEKEAIGIARERLKVANKKSGVLEVVREATYSSKRGTEIKVIQDFIIKNNYGDNVRVTYLHDFKYLGKDRYVACVPQPKVTIKQDKRR